MNCTKRLWKIAEETKDEEIYCYNFTNVGKVERHCFILEVIVLDFFTYKKIIQRCV